MMGSTLLAKVPLSSIRPIDCGYRCRDDILGGQRVGRSDINDAGIRNWYVERAILYNVAILLGTSDQKSAIVNRFQ